MRKRTPFLLVVCLLALNFSIPPARAVPAAAPSSAEGAPPSPRGSDDALKKATEKSLPLSVESNVGDAADIQAVLIPSSLAKKIFGKEIADNYAVIEVLVSNNDPKAAMVVQSLFLDYSDWALSGHLPGAVSSPLQDNQRGNKASQVASIEARLVRGELIDAQQWTLRNWTIRSLTFVGTAAVAFEFPFSSDVIRGIGAFNGTVVPGASTLWPDGTVNHINRISDFGFQTNKLISKQSAEPIVAFFPIDRFLLGSFRKEFLKRPAAWFVPYELMTDPKTRAEFANIVKPLYDGMTGTTSTDEAFFTDSMKAISPYTQCDEKLLNNTCKLKGLLNAVSLNNIRVVVQGVMTVDVATVPATIYAVTFDDGDQSDLWTKKTAQAGSITGVYLTGGVPELVDAGGKKIEAATFEVVAEGSTDTNLNFKMTLADCIPSGKQVYFVVKKTPGAMAISNEATAPAKKEPARSASRARPVGSTPFQFPAQPATACPAPANTPDADRAKDADKAKADEKPQEGDNPKEQQPQQLPTPKPGQPTPQHHPGGQA